MGGARLHNSTESASLVPRLFGYEATESARSRAHTPRAFERELRCTRTMMDPK